MKKNLYILATMLVSLFMVSCSDDDDVNNDTGQDTKPHVGLSYVSRIVVSDLKNPEAQSRTLKFLYDKQKRIVGISWGGTVVGRDTWHLAYSGNRIDIRYTGETDDIKRYCNVGADSTVASIYESTADATSEILLKYSDGLIIGAERNVSDKCGTYRSFTDFSWNGRSIVSSEERITKDDSDSLLISHKIIYDEFAPNNTNIDFNAVLDALNAMPLHYCEALSITGMYGSKSSQLVLKHTRNSKYADTENKSKEEGYQVISYSVLEGRITNIEIENESSGRHLKLNVIYKSDK